MDPTAFVSPFGRLPRPSFVVSMLGMVVVLIVIMGWAPLALFARGLWLAYLPFYWFLHCLLARRLHDSDRTAWWMAVALVPIVGPLVLLVQACRPSTVGPNRFGKDPYAMHLLRRRGAA